jgi:NADP-dependent 3-hydroxy acid dehydrogenase YdfG
MRDRIIVVTGASAGIGAALAQRVAALGAKPVLLARRKPELDEVAARCGPDALVIPPT